MSDYALPILIGLATAVAIPLTIIWLNHRRRTYSRPLETVEVRDGDEIPF